MDNESEQRGEGAEEWLAVPPDFGDWEAEGLLSERRVRRWVCAISSSVTVN